MPNYIDGEMKEQEKVCPTCKGITTIPTDKSDFDMCPECNAPKKEAIVDEIAEVIEQSEFYGWANPECRDDYKDRFAQAILDLIAEHYTPRRPKCRKTS